MEENLVLALLLLVLVGKVVIGFSFGNSATTRAIGLLILCLPQWHWHDISIIYLSTETEVRTYLLHSVHSITPERGTNDDKVTDRQMTQAILPTIGIRCRTISNLLGVNQSLVGS